MRNRLSQALSSAASLPARGLLALLWIYRHTFSPVLPVVFGPNGVCRFSPSCSAYAVDAVRTHGALGGTWLAMTRVLRCTPLHPGGFDPVRPRRPRCQRIVS